MVFLAGHIVAKVTYCATKLTATYFPNDWTVCGYHDIGVKKYRVVNQTLSLEKYWKLFPATLKDYSLRLLESCNYFSFKKTSQCLLVNSGIPSLGRLR